MSRFRSFVLIGGCALAIACAPTGGSGPVSTDEPEDPTAKPSDEPTGTETPNPTNTPEPATCDPGVGPVGHPTTAIGVGIGDSLPDFGDCLLDKDGEESNLYMHLGKVVLISMGAGWCGPCQSEAPDIQNLYETHGPDDFVVLMAMGQGYSQGSAPTNTFLEQWVNAYDITFPVVADPGFTLGQYYAPGDEGYIPLNLVVDRAGVVMYNNIGAIPVGTVNSAITAAIAEPNPFE